MRARTTEDALAAWRSAERLLEGLPPGTRAHERIRAVIVDLRDTYAELTNDVELHDGAVDGVPHRIAAPDELPA
jgi:hypothetical protein